MSNCHILGLILYLANYVRVSLYKGVLMKNGNIFLFKFSVLAVTIGLFSPSINLQTVQSDNPVTNTASVCFTVTSLFNQAVARGRVSAVNTRANVSRNVSRPAVVNSNTNRVSMKKNVRSPSGKLIKASRYYDQRRPYYYSDFYTGGGYYIDGNYHPVDKKKRSTATLTNLPLGAVISPAYLGSECRNINVGGSNFQKCGNSYFKPFFEEGILKYKVVKYPH